MSAITKELKIVLKGSGDASKFLEDQAVQKVIANSLQTMQNILQMHDKHTNVYNLALKSNQIFTWK